MSSSINPLDPLGSSFDYDFTPPPSCAVFEPTMEEWADALAYLEKIRPEAEKTGIIKIRPPEDWQPPFAVDVDQLKFTPRIQRLNELEAHTRIKLNFLDQVAKFWELQGSTLKIPLVEKRALDLYTLKRYVIKAGGFAKLTEEKRWQKVATDMGYSAGNKNIGNILKVHYERILYPLDIFEREEQRKAEALKEEIKDEGIEEGDEAEEERVGSPDDEKEYKPHNIPSRMGMKVPAEKVRPSRSKRHNDGGSTNGSENSSPAKKEGEKSPEKQGGAGGGKMVNSFSKELARLQFYGAGPKLAGMPSDKTAKEKRGSKATFEYDPLAKYMCQNCGKGDAEEQMLLCDGCDDSYHTFCLMPPLAEIPKGDWRCPKCIAAEVSKPMEAFGFEQAQKEYTLQSFGEMADQFKSDYFNMPVHLIPTTLVEKEYWRILDNIDEDVMVEYGADLHTMDHGSGFPTMSSKNLSKEDEVYAKSEWNLNRLPVVQNSILKAFDADISGMKVPWLYVGMCFSTFCWHTEDHWTPSINYLHWGEPKTWYGIPAEYAERAETVMRNSAKELFSGQPDLLHHIVTTMNPMILQAHGIPVFRADQHAGEFMVTFPRAYHAGFNQGYNLAEAVNFAPPDWLPMGRSCVEHYSMMRRYCVFCHDELVCKMAANADNLSLQVAAATYKDMVVMVEKEKMMRRQLLEAGVTEAEREAFELLPDDERQCALCKTTCFLSALTSVDNKDNEIICLRHFKSIECDPEKLILRYRYTLDELATLIGGLKARAECYDFWVDKVTKTLELKGDERVDFDELKDMHKEAVDRKYPDTELLQLLHMTVEEADKCQTVANQLGNKKVRTRTRGVADAAKYRLTVEELQLFAKQLEALPVKVSGQGGVEELLEQVSGFQKDATKLLEMDKPDAKDIEKCLELGVSLDVDLQELGELKTKHKHMEWLEEVQEILDDPKGSSFEQMKEVLETGTQLQPHPAVERALGEISGMLTQADSWEEKAKSCLSSRPAWQIIDVERLIREGEAISSGLPSLAVLREAMRKAKEWMAKAKSLRLTGSQADPAFPYLETLEALVAKGRPLPIKLEPTLTNLETQVASCRAWRERTARVFLKKNSSLTLLDVLCPRTDVGAEGKRRRKSHAQAQGSREDVSIPHPTFQHLTPQQLADPKKFVQTYHDSEREELEAMKKLRERNKLEGDTAKIEGRTGAKMECELCLEYFHPGQIPLQQLATGSAPSGSNGSPGSPGSSQEQQQKKKVSSLREIKFLCPVCLVSRRPRLETILSLLVSLQKLNVRLPEGEALQCLAERAMAWKSRAEAALATEEVKTAFAKLQEHKSTDGNKSEGEGDSPRRSPKAYEIPEVSLGSATVAALEELMLMGDLLEVSLDESQHIWRLLQATEPRRSKEYPDLGALEAELESVREEKMKARRKRRMESGEKGEKGEGGGKRQKKEVTTTKRRTGKANSEEDDGEGEDEQEDCSAPPSCLKPTGKEVHWVQCDGCELWYHLFCLGLKPEQVSEDEDFICKTCKPNKNKKRKSDAK